MGISQMFETAALQYPDQPCLVYRQRSWRYRRAALYVQLLSRRLAACFDPGERVLITCSDPVKQLLYFLAAVRAGGVCVLADAGMELVRDQAWQARHQIKLWIDDEFRVGKMSGMVPQQHAGQLFLGVLSAGSAGLAKLIWRDHSSWISAFAVQSRVFGIGSADRLYLAGNLSYSANLNACLHMLTAGGTVILAASRQPRSWVQEMAERQASVVFMVPVHYRLLLEAVDRPLCSVRRAISAGDKLDGKTIRQLIICFPTAIVYEYYGAAELGYVSYADGAALLARPHSVGRPFPGVNIEIKQGVVYVQSPYLAPAFRPQGTAGDLGVLDMKGYLHLQGRQQFVINAGGIKIVPYEVEAVLRQCPGVAAAAVDSIVHPVRGRRVCAWIVTNQAVVTPGQLYAVCRRHLSRAAWPRRFMFVTELPLLPSGKLDRARLRAMHYDQD